MSFRYILIHQTWSISAGKTHLGKTENCRQRSWHIFQSKFSRHAEDEGCYSLGQFSECLHHMTWSSAQHFSSHPSFHELVEGDLFHLKVDRVTSGIYVVHSDSTLAQGQHHSLAQLWFHMIHKYHTFTHAYSNMVMHTQSGDVAASVLAEHRWSTGQYVGLSKAEVVDAQPSVTTQCLLESWHIQCHPHTLNCG